MAIKESKGRTSSTILHRLYLWYRDQPEHTAHFFRTETGWHPITVKSFWEQTLRIASFLRQQKIGEGNTVVIFAMNSPEWIQWELGTWLAGAMSIGLHPNTAIPDLKSILKRATPSYLVTESSLFSDRLKEIAPQTQIKTFAEAAEALREAELLPASNEEINRLSERFLSEIDTSKPQSIVFTSGTSGIPRGVQLGLKQYSFVADALAREWNLSFGEGTLFSFLPLSHVAEKLQSIAVAISQRYTVWFNSDYRKFFEELAEVQPTMFLAVPRIWERIREQVESKKPKLLHRLTEFKKVGAITEKIFLAQMKKQLGLERLKLAVSGASKLPEGIGDWFQKLGIEIQEIYGMSESCGLITLTKDTYNRDFSLIGIAPLGVEVEVNLEGEVLVRGENVFFGYYGEELDEEVITEGWLHTGDLGEWVEHDGFSKLRMIGRNREIIKLSNGRMVAPAPIENTLKEIPGISNVCVTGEGKPHLMALFTLQEKTLMEIRFIPGAIEGLTVEDDSVKKKIRDELDRLFQEGRLSERITQFVILSRDFSVEQKELTATQKLNRRQIEKNFQYFLQLSYDFYA